MTHLKFGKLGGGLQGVVRGCSLLSDSVSHYLCKALA